MHTAANSKRSRLRVLDEHEVDDEPAPSFSPDGERDTAQVTPAAPAFVAPPPRVEFNIPAIASAPVEHTSVEPGVSKKHFDETAQLILVVLSKVVDVLSERFANLLLPLLSLVGGFALWYRMLEQPSDRQLVGLGLYGAFTLLLTAFNRRR